MESADGKLAGFGQADPAEAAADGSAGTGLPVMMYEYAVKMECERCADAVRTALSAIDGVQSVTTNVEAQLIVVEGSVPSDVVRCLPCVECTAAQDDSGQDT